MLSNTDVFDFDLTDDEISSLDGLDEGIFLLPSSGTECHIHHLAGLVTDWDPTTCP